jgi:nucleoside-diphosphate-sugar epimerase
MSASILLTGGVGVIGSHIAVEVARAGNLRERHALPHQPRTDRTEHTGCDLVCDCINGCGSGP